MTFSASIKSTTKKYPRFRERDKKASWKGHTTTANQGFLCFHFSWLFFSQFLLGVQQLQLPLEDIDLAPQLIPVHVTALQMSLATALHAVTRTPVKNPLIVKHNTLTYSKPKFKSANHVQVLAIGSSIYKSDAFVFPRHYTRHMVLLGPSASFRVRQMVSFQEHGPAIRHKALGLGAWSWGQVPT